MGGKKTKVDTKIAPDGVLTRMIEACMGAAKAGGGAYADSRWFDPRLCGINARLTELGFEPIPSTDAAVKRGEILRRPNGGGGVSIAIANKATKGAMKQSRAGTYSAALGKVS